MPLHKVLRISDCSKGHDGISLIRTRARNLGRMYLNGQEYFGGVYCKLKEPLITRIHTRSLGGQVCILWLPNGKNLPSDQSRAPALSPAEGVHMVRAIGD